MTAEPDDVTALDALESLRRRVVGLANHTLDQLEYDLAKGSLTQRQNAIRIVAPHLLRSLETHDEDSALSELKKEFADLMGLIMGAGDAPTEITFAPDPDKLDE